MRAVYRLRLGDPRWRKKIDSSTTSRDGQEFALPVLEGLEPEPRCAGVLERGHRGLAVHGCSWLYWLAPDTACRVIAIRKSNRKARDREVLLALASCDADRVDRLGLIQLLRLDEPFWYKMAVRNT